MNGRIVLVIRNRNYLAEYYNLLQDSAQIKD